MSTVFGYPRQGANRELKKAIESYWAGRTDAASLLATTRGLRLSRLSQLRQSGLGEIPSNDFSLYDHVLDTAVMLGAIPPRFGSAEGLDRYFAMARGAADVAPLEMTKWFDTNYHYLVPELGPDTAFSLDASKPLAEFTEALRAGVLTRPVLVGPVTFLLLAKGPEPLSLLDRIVPLYADLLAQLSRAGAEWVQLDEPALVLDQPPAVLDAVTRAYATLTTPSDRPKLLVASYFDRLGDALPVLRSSDVDGIGLDLTGPAAANLADLEAIGGIGDKRLVAGVISGHNVWAADLDAALTTLERLRGLARRVDVAASCSLLHVPLDVALERDLDPSVVGWLAFARQKLEEIVTLTTGLNSGRDAIADKLRANSSRRAARAASPLVRNDEVRRRAAAVTAADLRRASPYGSRHLVQAERLKLPPLPTTTIGSFPQTTALRTARAALRDGTLTTDGYGAAMRDSIKDVIDLQEEFGVDVLVHGEPERNDMVQYFAERLDGFLATTDGWVQSYGTRYVRPPIILGDVSRPSSMTVEWAAYAQSLTSKPVKGMLTGPVTMLAWSFVRDDQPRAATARQVALALRDEVNDLEAAGIGIIQVDEPALRETLPLRHADRAGYLGWAVEAFQLTTSGVRDETQIHTHMCYAEFGDVLQAIIDMDADVISLEAARSQMAIVTDLARADYPNEVGPGVWDIHSPRVPSVEEITDHLRTATGAFPVERLWVNPDCGLKTRGYPEVRATLANMITAARQVRSSL
jgi:5-methyltetrahydropteroyltriglutamate--homocysteine methyltransferase